MRSPLLLILIALGMISCSAESPDIVITPDKWELQNVLAGSRTKETFWVKNTGIAPLITNFRANCDCIELLAQPDTVMPGDSARLVARYDAPLDKETDKKSIMWDSNVKDKKVGKIEVTASIIPFKVTKETKNITMIPFTVKNPQDQKYIDLIFKAFALKTRDDLGLTFVSFKDLAEKISTDPEYGKGDLPPVVRKWAGALDIRYVVMGEIVQQNNTPVLVIVLIDALYEYPITKMVQNPNMETISLTVKKEVKDIFDNIDQHKKNAMMQHLQTKWMKARQELVGKPAPPLVLNNAISGEKVDISKDKGDVVFIHFFSIDCEHCEEEVEWVSSLTKQMPNLKAYGISVDVGEEDSVRAYLNEKQIPYTVLLPDESQSYQLDEYYGGATPQSVIIDKEGKVREVMVGFNKAITTKFTQLLQKMRGE